MTTKEYLSLYRKYPDKTNKYWGWRRDLKAIKKFNKDLLSKYPWLEPHNDWSGKRITDCAKGEKGFWPGDPDKLPTYDYEYTLLDDMPEGWRIAFGDQMVEEIHQELVKFNYVDKYFITTIKEKYGSLRWYDNGTPYKLSKDYQVIIRKGFETLKNDWDPKQYVLKEDHSEHYIPFFDRGDKSQKEIDEYNKLAVHYYHLYKIEDECKVPEIVSKYEELSGRTCIKCGQPARWFTKGWISPYCDECKAKMIAEGKRTEDSFVLN